jgi:hypothetical protein
MYLCRAEARFAQPADGQRVPRADVSRCSKLREQRLGRAMGQRGDENAVMGRRDEERCGKSCAALLASKIESVISSALLPDSLFSKILSSLCEGVCFSSGFP